ncbi:MAG: ABC transporter ATP-binding protein [Desulfurococcaceae archaeon]
MTKIVLENISKYYGNVIAVDDVNLVVDKGEFFTLLGPSGCGKTTTLRLIAGFEVPDKGKIYFDNDEVTFLKPYKRSTAMVFQNYALWPHMTVFENVAYGLKIKKKELRLTDEDIKKRVEWALELVKLNGFENRYPLQLSGGQQQRVALARALVVQPRVLLLDEPLSNLDAKLRVEMREELRKIQKTLGITTIYVTHDQLEAMSMSDRIAIMNRGRVIQVGTPKDLYFSPRALFVADFLGRSSIYKGEVVKQLDNLVEVQLEDTNILVRGFTYEKQLPRKVSVVIRPEVIKISGEKNDPHDTILKGTLEFAMFTGDKIEGRVKIAGLRLLVYYASNLEIPLGSEVEIVIPWRNTIVLPHTES